MRVHSCGCPTWRILCPGRKSGHQNLNSSPVVLVCVQWRRRRLAVAEPFDASEARNACQAEFGYSQKHTIGSQTCFHFFSSLLTNELLRRTRTLAVAVPKNVYELIVCYDVASRELDLAPLACRDIGPINWIILDRDPINRFATVRPGSGKPAQLAGMHALFG